MENQIFNGIQFVADGKGYYRELGNFKNLMHRYVWTWYNGNIPKGYEIHHIDFDRSNNNISNLQLVSRSEHRRIHADLLTDEQREWKRNNLKMNAVPKAAEWHGSQAGHEWHSQQIKMQRELGQFKHKLICTYCGKTYVGEINGQNTFCSGKCKSAYRRKTGVDNVEHICPVCGNTFSTNKYKPTVTCSRSCANRWRNRRGN